MEAHAKPKIKFYLGPFANGIQIHPSVDQRCSQLTPPSLECVGPERDGALEFICLNAGNRFWDAEHPQKGVQHKVIVAVVCRQVSLELVHILCARSQGLLDDFTLGCRLLLLLFGSLKRTAVT